MPFRVMVLQKRNLLKPQKARFSMFFDVLSERPEAMLSELFNGAAERHLREGEALFRAGDAGDGCYQIKTGLAKVVIASLHGEECTISLLRPNAVVGELSMIDGRTRSASVVAISECSLLFVSRAKFQEQIERHPELPKYLLRTLARRLRDADDAIAASTFLSVKGRLARALLNLVDYVGKDIGGGGILLNHKISQGDLAAMAGVARENVSRTMSEWHKLGIVTHSAHYYCIKAPKALAREMDDSSATLL